MDELIVRVGRTVFYISAPNSDYGIDQILPVADDKFVFSVSNATYHANYLFLGDSGRTQSLGNGSISIDDPQHLIFRKDKAKGYLLEKRGKETVAHGAFWYSALIDQNGDILKFINTETGPGIVCMDRQRFEAWSGIDLPAISDDRICIRQ